MFRQSNYAILWPWSWGWYQTLWDGLIPSFHDRVFFQDFHVRCSWAFRIFDCDNSKSIDVTEFGASVKVCTRSICQSRFLFQFFHTRCSKTFQQEVWKIFEGVGESDIIGDQDQIADDLVDICVWVQITKAWCSMIFHLVNAMDRVAKQWLGTIVENHCHFNLSHGFLSKTIDNSIVPKYTIWYDSFRQKRR